ncbi:hypothetical protein GIB67_035767 [Kingdonia uniflora]|uniref:3'-5' exonuclease domain-containing protein n=1 Tax=Kingdonia uniflora TaxID=39325 RepID=A0A7J7MJQ6_9MAGN|nr:hypothetical protein GIB67_035767 [Kingdonia uniflora]
MKDYTFVGVGINADNEKLQKDYNLRVYNVADLRDIAGGIGKFNLSWVNNVGLKGLAEKVLGIILEKPQAVTLSNWDNNWLNDDQVQYATIDAFVSFEIARSFNLHLGF